MDVVYGECTSSRAHFHELDEGVNCSEAQNIKGVNCIEARTKGNSVGDRVASGVLRRPTEAGMADTFTKPLQEMIFYELQDQIVNLDSSGPYPSSQRSVLENNDNEQVNPEGVNLEDKVKDNMADADIGVEVEQLSVSGGIRQSYKEALLYGGAESKANSVDEKGDRSGLGERADAQSSHSSRFI
jgi:hypothetical protein